MLVGARPVDRGYLRAHRPQVCRELATVMDLVQQESPGHMVAGFPHHFLSIHHERKALLEARRGNGVEALGQIIVLAVVLRDHLADLAGAGNFDPGELAFLHALDEHSLLPDNEPCNLARRPRFGIGSIVAAVLGNAADHFACRERLPFPVADVKIFVLHGSSARFVNGI